VDLSPSKLRKAAVQILALNLQPGTLKTCLTGFPEHFIVHEGIWGPVCLTSLPNPEHVPWNFSSNDLLSLRCSTRQGFVPSAISILESANIQGLGGGL
jgi:hypothetical protein